MLQGMFRLFIDIHKTFSKLSLEPKNKKLHNILLSLKINIQIFILFQLDIIMAQPEPEPASECIKCSEGRHENCLRYKGYFLQMFR